MRKSLKISDINIQAKKLWKKQNRPEDGKNRQ